MYRIVESLYCTPKSNVAAYVNYTIIRINEKKFPPEKKHEVI